MDKVAKKHQELVNEVQNRLNLALVVAVFFPGLVVALSEIAKNDPTKSNNTLLDWSLVAGMYIATYFLFEIFKEKIRTDFLKLINRSLLFGIGVFIFPILLITIHKNAGLTAWLSLPLVVSLLLILTAPIGILSFVITGRVFWKK